MKSDYKHLQALKAIRDPQLKLTPEDKAQALLAYVEKHGNVPPYSFVHVFAMGVWWQAIKHGRSKNIYETLLQSNTILKFDFDRLQVSRETKALQTQLTPEDKARALLAYVEKHRKVPLQSYVVDGFRMDAWWHFIMQGQSKTIYETLLQSNTILKSEYERVQALKAAKALKSKGQ